MSPQPLYINAMKEIKSWIDSGEMPKGSRLPSERLLVERLKVSRITVLRALKELEQSGYVIRRQGSGTYVQSTTPMFSASSIPAHSKVNISFGINGFEEYKYFYWHLIDLFQRENPDVNVELRALPMSKRQGEDPYLIGLASGDVPTVGEFYLHADYAALNGLVALDDIPDFKEATENISSDMIYMTCDYDGLAHVHALPIYYMPRMMLANTTLCEDAGIDLTRNPSSFSELKEWAGKLGELSKKRQEEFLSVHISFPEHWSSIIDFLPLIWATEGYNPVFNKEDFIYALNGKAKWLQFYLKNLVDLRQKQKEAQAKMLFMLGKIGLLINDYGLSLRLARFMSPDFRIRPLNLPPHSKDENSTTVYGDMSIGIFRSEVKGEEKLDAAWRWVKFLLKSKVQAMVAENFIAFPIVRGVSVPEFSDQGKDVRLKAMETAKRQYDFPGVRKVFTILAQEMRTAISSGIGAEECLAKSRERIIENVY